MFHMQEVLNVKYGGHEWRNKMTIGKVKCAILDEVGELLRESESKWRWWKHNKNDDKQKAVFEFIDIVHFMMLAILHTRTLAEVEDDMTTYGWLLAMEGHCDGEDDVDAFANAMTKFINPGIEEHDWLIYLSLVFDTAARMLGLGENDIYDAYILKNSLNHKRVDGGILSGIYDKSKEAELVL